MRTKFIVIAAASLLLALLVTVTTGAKKKDDPVKVFKKMGCAECHSIVALEIEIVEPKETEEAEAAAAEGEEDDVEPPDLSDVGKERDAKWISNYLRKKADIDGRKHEKRFKGSTEERRMLAMWLAKLKHEMPDKEEEGSADKTESP